MTRVNIASFESKTRGTVEVYRGHDQDTVNAIYEHSNDPGITKTLGSKDLNRFSPTKFPDWVNKGGGRYLYTAWNNSDLAAVFWIGGEAFPASHFPDSTARPPYTAAWRTGYSTPEGGTYEGEGIGKRIAIAGIADVVALTQQGGPTYEDNDTTVVLPPLKDSGIWIDTGVNNTDGQALYHHLGNTGRGQEPIGFNDVGIYTPPFKEGKSALELEPRVGMVADSQAIQQLVAAAGVLVKMK